MIELRKLIFQMFNKTSRLLQGKGIGSKISPFVTNAYDFLFRHLRPDGIVLTEVQGHKMYLDSCDKAVATCLLRCGSWEKFETSLFKRLIKRGMIVVDIGANVGYYTLIAADLVGKEGRIFAFEPDPDNYALLLKNIEVNGYSNVTPVRKAISNKVGTSKLFLCSEENKAEHRLYDSHDGRESIYS